ncbi:MAG: glutaredoxin family protein [Thermodesulfovibrionales bacterium]|nr:glutaredoxin family protein [Thermodesulfovibrionales bacterium]
MAKKIIFYSLSGCPACKKARQFMDAKGIHYEYIEVDKFPQNEQNFLCNEIKRFNPDLTFPTIVVSDVIVGYSEDMLKNLNN